MRGVDRWKQGYVCYLDLPLLAANPVDSSDMPVPCIQTYTYIHTLVNGPLAYLDMIDAIYPCMYTYIPARE